MHCVMGSKLLAVLRITGLGKILKPLPQVEMGVALFSSSTCLCCLAVPMLKVIKISHLLNTYLLTFPDIHHMFYMQPLRGIVHREKETFPGIITDKH